MIRDLNIRHVLSDTIQKKIAEVIEEGCDQTYLYLVVQCLYEKPCEKELYELLDAFGISDQSLIEWSM